MTLYICVHNDKLKKHTHHSSSKLLMMLGINKNHVENLLKCLDSLFRLGGTNDKMLVWKFREFYVFVIVLERQVKRPEVVHSFLRGQRSILLFWRFLGAQFIIFKLNFYYVISLLDNIYVMPFLLRYFNCNILRVHMVDEFNLCDLSFYYRRFSGFHFLILQQINIIVFVRIFFLIKLVIAFGIFMLLVT